MLQKVTLTKIYTTDKAKDGKPLKNKKGYPYTRMSIKTAEHGDKWISGFQNKDNKNWKEGDRVEILIEEHGTYMDFSVPRVEEQIKAENKKIGEQMAVLYELLLKIAEKVGVDIKPKIGSTGVVYPEDDINSDDIPF